MTEQEFVEELAARCRGREEVARTVQAMAAEHRTTQQRFTELALSWLFCLAAKAPGEYDARNAASVQFAKAAVEALRAHDRFPEPTGGVVRLPYV